LEEQYYIVQHHEDGISGSEDIEDDGEEEDSATDVDKVEPLARPRRHPNSPPDSPPPPSLSLITDTFPVRRPLPPSTDGTSTRGLPLTSQAGVKSRKSYKLIPVYYM